jgi:hypothetical protein
VQFLDKDRAFASLEPVLGSAPELVGPSSRQLVLETIARVGSSLEIYKFFSVVVRAHHEAQDAVMPHDMYVKFKQSDSYAGFHAALGFSLNALARPCSILVVGAGAGYAGCSSEYARGVIRGLGSAYVKNVESLELTPEMIQFPTRTEKSTYDLVVSHSLAHFVPMLSSFFTFVSAHIKFDGIFVMGHEFNAHFWTDPRIAQLRTRYQRRQRWEKIARNTLSPSAYFRWMRSTLCGSISPSLWDVVNDILRDRHGFKDRLTPSEISALVDPHLPNGSSYQVGLRGMDAHRVQKVYLPDFKLEHFNASEFPGLDENKVLKSDLPGRIFNAVYRRSPQR